MLPRETVIAAFRLILGRPPESEAVISHHQGLGTEAALSERILASAEFARRYRALNADAPSPISAVLPPMDAVELTDDPGDLAKMLAQTSATWTALGEARPHHSVMGHPDFLPERLAENEAAAEQAFSETGRDELALLDGALARFPQAERLRAGLCLEVGCGIGRMTVPLASRFSQVLGVDVSETHLVLARQTARQHRNITLRRITQIEDYAGLPKADFVYTRYVLHHNAPPVQRAMLGAMLGRLAPGGGAMLQTVTSIEGYRFETEAYLATGGREQETHPLPQRALFATLEALGLRLVEVQRDDTASDQPWLRSMVILAERPPSAR